MWKLKISCSIISDYNIGLVKRYVKEGDLDDFGKKEYEHLSKGIKFKNTTELIWWPTRKYSQNEIIFIVRSAKVWKIE